MLLIDLDELSIFHNLTQIELLNSIYAICVLLF